jgi:glycosyltransferase involved in cell wall biosynthesis
MGTLPASHGLSGKRVLYGVTKSNGGGAQRYVEMLARGARAAGMDVSAMAGSADGAKGGPGPLFQTFEKEGIPSTYLSEIERDVKGAGERRALSEVIDAVKDAAPDVLHLNSSKLGLLGAFAGRRAGVSRIIFTAHGWPHMESRPLWWKVMAWLGSWWTIALSHKIICVSESDRRGAPTLLFRDKLALVYNGISDFPRLPREEARAALIKRSHDLSKYSTWLVMNAELHPNKGIGTAIRAVAELAHRHSDIALVVCGEGQSRNGLAELALELGVSSRVFLLGFVPEARQFLNAADIYLMPSRKEGFPFALLEAGLASLPVIAAKVGGIPEVITDHKTGLYMPRDNTHILAQAIVFYLNNPDKAAQYGAQLREHVLSNFSEEKMVTLTLALY